MARAHVILPDELLEKIDEMVGKRKRSECITEVLEKEVRRKRRMELAPRMAGFLKDADIPEWETRESIDRWVREQREWPDPWVEATPGDDASPRERRDT